MGCIFLERSVRHRPEPALEMRCLFQQEPDSTRIFLGQQVTPAAGFDVRANDLTARVSCRADSVYFMAPVVMGGRVDDKRGNPIRRTPGSGPSARLDGKGDSKRLGAPALRG